MNIVLWIVAGAVLGLASYSLLGLNESRGKAVSMVIGAFGGVLGGKEVAPIFVSPTTDFSSASMMIALAVAALFLFVGEFVRNRWGL